jgi:hypothetical protein
MRSRVVGSQISFGLDDPHRYFAVPDNFTK